MNKRIVQKALPMTLLLAAVNLPFITMIAVTIDFLHLWMCYSLLKALKSSILSFYSNLALCRAISYLVIHLVQGNTPFPPNIYLSSLTFVFSCYDSNYFHPIFKKFFLFSLLDPLLPCHWMWWSFFFFF